MITTASLEPATTLPVVRQFERQILRSTRAAGWSTTQQAALLSWARAHLIGVYVARQLDHLAGGGSQRLRARLDPDGTLTGRIGRLLRGETVPAVGLPVAGLPLEDLSTPVSGARLLAWVHRRLELAAQRTRWHTETDLTQLRQALEALLLTSALARFGLGEFLEEVDVPAPAALDATARGCVAALQDAHGFAWKSTPPRPVRRLEQVSAGIQVAARFGQALVRADFASTWNLLTTAAQRRWPPPVLRQTVADLFLYIEDERLERVLVLHDFSTVAWPARQARDLAWVHLALESPSLAQVLSLVLVPSPQGARIRQLDWDDGS